VTFRGFADVYRGYRTPNLSIIEHLSRWFTLSGVLIVLSIIGIATGLTYSIDFTGGAQISYRVAETVEVPEVQAVLAEYGLEGEVQLVEGPEGPEVAIRTTSLTGIEGADQLRRDLADQAGVPVTEVSIEDIGPTWGRQLRSKALISLVLALAAITLYITIRFQWEMALGAMVALAHDVIITAGIYALTGREITPETVIALLTILGFSLYDTVVIYDKVAENAGSPALLARLGYREVVNLSLNQTVMRSVNTSLVVLLPILSLLLFGGETLKDFAFAMFVGVAIGAYSSIFIAPPVLVLVRKDKAPAKPVRAGVQRPAVTTASAPAAAKAGDDAEQTVTPARSTRPAPKSKRRPPSKRKRR
jgi:preprotein translocase SecF subunit